MVYSTAGTPNCSDWNACNSNNYSWQQWTGAGLDAHSTIANPTFADTKKTWPGRTPPYFPVGDYNPTNTTAMNAIKFQTFAMDSFGIIGTVPGLLNLSCGESPVKLNTKTPVWDAKSIVVNYHNARLMVDLDGAYDMIITSVSGCVYATRKGEGTFTVALDKKRFGSGAYIVVIKQKNNSVASRFFVGI